MVARDRRSDRRFRQRARAARCLSAGALLICAGCAGLITRATDREVDAAVSKYETRMRADRTAHLKLPVAKPPPATAAAESTPPPPTDVPATAAAKELDLRESLRIAFSTGREYLTQKEALYLEGLQFTLTRYTFGPILDSTIEYLWNYNEASPNSHSLRLPLSVRQILPLGGQVTGSVAHSAARVRDLDPLTPNDFQWTSDYQVNLQQPLLRGAGYQASHEALTQAQRSLLYAVRAFELFRQDYAIRIADAYYGLVSQKKQLENDEQNYLDAAYDTRKAEALRKLDRNKPDDVFQARRREITEETALLGARTRYQLALDEFKILLGLPTATPIELAAVEPPFERIDLESRSAVEVALHNRLELHTQRDGVDDAKRRLRISRQDLLPRFDATAAYGTASRGGVTDDATPNQRSGSAGLTLELPLDRKAEANAYRSAQIAVDRAQRDLRQAEDELERNVLNALRELEQFEKQITLQEEQIVSERRAVAVMQIRVEADEAQQRDLSEARQSLNTALNQLIDLKVQHFIARLRLKRNLGILFVNPEGMWES